MNTIFIWDDLFSIRHSKNLYKSPYTYNPDFRVNSAQEEELYGPDPVPRDESPIPDDRAKPEYSPGTEIVYRMQAAKEVFFEDEKNGYKIKVWQPENNQFGTCIIGATISLNDEAFSRKVGFIFYAVEETAITPPRLFTKTSTWKGYVFWRPVPKTGYVCPGTAVARSGKKPNPRQYCCFKEKYLTNDNVLTQGQRAATQKHRLEVLMGRDTNIFFLWFCRHLCFI